MLRSVTIVCGEAETRGSSGKCGEGVGGCGDEVLSVEECHHCLW